MSEEAQQFTPRYLHGELRRRVEQCGRDHGRPNVHLVELYRLGPFRAQMLILHADRHYDTIDVTAWPAGDGTWTQYTLDTWLLDELVRKLERFLSMRGVG